MNLEYIKQKEKRLKDILNHYDIVDEKKQNVFIEEFSKEFLKI